MNDSGETIQNKTEQKPRSPFTNTLQVQSYQLSSKMENIITNPGLQHLAEKIFWNLDVEHLKICGLINQSCQQLLDNPMFWLRKFVGLSKDNQKDWINVIKSVKNSEEEKAVIFYLQWNLKKEVLVDPR